MRIGQTSFVVFVSKVSANALGFLATVYFARVLGAEVLGYYAVILALVAWLGLAGDIGVSKAMVKRISEGTEQSAYFTAGVVVTFALAAVISIGVLAFHDAVNAYVGIQAASMVVLLLLAGSCKSLVTAALNGERLVHISGVLTPLKIGGRSLFQIALVVAGSNLFGMIVGYAAGTVLAALVGFTYVSVRLTRPRARHFRQLYDYAKFSWLGNLQNRSFNDVDIIVLGALVPSALVGIYSVAWSIAKFLTLFGDSVSATLFPELSFADADNRTDLIEDLITNSIAYGGLIAIPGLFGSVVLGDRLLRIYGSEFTEGTAVLTLLILATLVFGYQKLLLNAINALDRPDVAFRINAVFIATNVTLNVGLILWIGWVGAAIATVISALGGTALSFWLLRKLVDFDAPTGQILRQTGAAVSMTVVVIGAQNLLESSFIARNNAAIVLSLVAVGAGFYFLALLAISREFRRTVSDNSPIRIPFVS